MASSSFQHSLYAVLLPAAVALASCAGAHAAETSPQNPFATPLGGVADIHAVAPGATFIAEPSGQAFALFNPINLHVKTTAWKEAGQVQQVRLFRLGQGNWPDRYAYFGDCDVFLTVVLSVNLIVDRGRQVLQLQGMERPFLEVDARANTMTPGRWMAVFETTKVEPSGVFRLRQSTKMQYFEGGWIFTLSTDKPSNQYTAKEVSAAAAGQVISDDLLKDLKRQDTSRPCHIASMTRVADGREQVQLLACTDDDLTF